MGIRLSPTACGHAIDDEGTWFSYFASPEDAMQREPGQYGWYTSKVQHVDCPECLAALAPYLARDVEEAQRNARGYLETAERATADLAIVSAKLKALGG